jgi:hypothetical protein
MMTYAWPAWKFTADTEVLHLRHLRNKNARFACTYISSQNYTVSKRKLDGTTRMIMFAALDKARIPAENVNVNLAPIRRAALQVTGTPLPWCAVRGLAWQRPCVATLHVGIGHKRLRYVLRPAADTYICQHASIRKPTKTVTHENGQIYTFVREGAPRMTIVFNIVTIIRASGPMGVRGGGASTPWLTDWTSFVVTWAHLVSLLLWTWRKHSF